MVKESVETLIWKGILSSGEKQEKAANASLTDGPFFAPHYLGVFIMTSSVTIHLKFLFRSFAINSEATGPKPRQIKREV
jgi:hypothetical protein